MDDSELYQEAQKLLEVADLSTIKNLAQEQYDLEARLVSLEMLMLECKELLRDVSEKKLPEAMASVGMKEFKLENGAAVSIKLFYSGSITPDNAKEAFSWLKDNEHGDAIKRQFTIAYGMGNEEEADKALDVLEKNSLPYSEKTSVHPQTLSSIIKEHVQGGLPFPLKTFNAYVGTKTKIKLPKAKP
jgi:hypothetical protein